MTTATHLITAEELAAMPVNGHQYELVKGELQQMTPAGHKHGKLAMLIGVSLGHHVLANDLGMVYAAETGFTIARDPDTVRAPDVSFISQKTIDQLGEPETTFWPGAPDLVVEVISPNDIYLEVEEKVFDWLEAGAQMVIVINPRKKIVKLYRSITSETTLTEHDVIDGSDVVPGWTMAVKDLFR